MKRAVWIYVVVRYRQRILQAARRGWFIGGLLVGREWGSMDALEVDGWLCNRFVLNLDGGYELTYILAPGGVS